MRSRYSSLIFVLMLVWSWSASAVRVVVVADDSRSELVESFMAEAPGALGDGHSFDVVRVSVGAVATELGKPGDTRVVVAIGPEAVAAVVAARLKQPVILAGTVLVDAMPKAAPNQAIAVAWSIPDAVDFLKELGVGSVIGVGPEAMPGSPVEWIVPSAAAQRQWVAGSGVVLSPTEFPGRSKLISQLRAARVAVYDMSGGDALSADAAAGPAQSLSADRLARWAGLRLRAHVTGRMIRDVTDLRNATLMNAIRPDVAAALGLQLSWQLASRSRILAPSGGEALKLTGAVREALANNHNLLASQAGVVGAEADVRSARSSLLPSIDGSIQGRWIDQDRARSSQGGNPELSLDGALSLSQLIYSHDVWTQYRVSQASERATRHQHHGAILDTTLSAALGWIAVQRAQATLVVQTRTLDATRTNLRLAQARKRAGQSGDADIIRWESQVASDIAAFHGGVLQVMNSRLGLNRVLGRRGVDPRPLLVTKPETVLAELGGGDLRKLLTATDGARKLEEMMLRTALSLDPEIRRLNELVAAQTTLADGTRAGIFIPSLSVQAQVSHQLAQAGDGARPDPVPDGFPDQTTGQVLLALQWPLFDGGSRYARIDRAEADQMVLKRSLEAREVELEQRVRSAFRTLTISLVRAELQQQSADAAQRNFDLVSASYKRGGSNVTHLLDARSQLQNTELAAVDARYQIVENLLEAHRSIGVFYFLLNDEEKARWNKSLTTLNL